MTQTRPPGAGTLLLAGTGERLGTAVARRFHEAGWSVALVARSGDIVDPLASDLDRAVALRGDVTDADDIDRIVAETRAMFGSVDCLVCNASAGGGAPVGEATPASFERVWRIRALGSFLLVRACLEDLQANGTVLFSGTTYASEPAVEQVEWASGAAATRGFAETLAAGDLNATYIEIAAALRPPDSNFPGAIGVDTVANRYLTLAESDDPPGLIRIDPPE
ncbi:SDR family oxidoreductase [Halosegnis sp.]|uniref:SDR family oxidoreductase n=1 Tax=Halosegnis sp. TaxID=2864959 RepID=UPI0035D406C8